MSEQQSSQTQSKQKAKGTKVTEAIIGAASNKMVTATKALNDAVANALKLTETLDENALKIADQEERLASLQQDFNNKRAQQKVELELAVKADRKSVVETYVKENNLVVVEQSEYEDIQRELQVLKTDFDQKVKAEIGKAQGIADSKAEAAKQLAEAQYKAKEAENLAEIKNLQSQLKFANEQTALWKSQLDAEREAGVKRAQASAVGTISVTGAGK